MKDKETNKKGKKILICHADLNGAMNIGRKAISGFNIETIGQSKQNKEIYGYRIVCLRNYSVEKQMFAEIKK